LADLNQTGDDNTSGIIQFPEFEAFKKVEKA